MNNVIMRRIEVTAEYQPLSKTRLLATATLSCLPTNIQSVYFRGDDGSDVPWVPGEWHEVRRINLNELLVKGTPGDVVTIIGGTW